MKSGGDSIVVVHPLFQEESGGSIPTSPLQLFIGEITLEQASKLNYLWHSRLPETHGLQMAGHLICFGAEFENRFYASAIWSDPIARMLNGRGWLELRRMAINDNAPKNTASRMISIMLRIIKKKFPEIKRVISYQDTEVHSGTIYKASGWVAEATSGNADGWQSRNRRLNQASGDKIRWGRDI